MGTTGTFGTIVHGPASVSSRLGGIRRDKEAAGASDLPPTIFNFPSFLMDALKPKWIAGRSADLADLADLVKVVESLSR